MTANDKFPSVMFKQLYPNMYDKKYEDTSEENSNVDTSVRQKLKFSVREALEGTNFPGVVSQKVIKRD